MPGREARLMRRICVGAMAGRPGGPGRGRGVDCITMLMSVWTSNARIFCLSRKFVWIDCRGYHVEKVERIL